MAKFSALLDNCVSGVSSIRVNNLEPFSVGDPILIGEIGQYDAEILKVKALDPATNTITLGDSVNNATTTTFSHSESTKVTILLFDQIQFYWTAATGTISDENPTFSDSNPLTGWISLDPTSYYSVYQDVNNDTGFGWFMYKNALTDDVSQESNPIPYAGFTGNTAQQIISSFQSMLNTNELKLVTYNDMFNWMNEAIALVKNKLNLSNVEYTVSTMQTLNVVGGTAEYILPSNFSDLIEIVDQNFLPISAISVSDDLTHRGDTTTDTVYYLRGRYIGFSPIPSGSTTVYYRYRANATRVSSLSTYIDLPDNMFYCIKDYMMYMSCQKFGNPMGSSYYQSFKNSLDLYIMASIKRNADLDTWGMGEGTNT